MVEADRAVQINLRCTPEEGRAIKDASAALRITQSQLVELALIEACAELGMQLLDDTPPRLKPEFVWPWKPKRAAGVTARARVVAYVPAVLYPAFENAAWAVRLSVPLYAIGAALRLVARGKLINEWRQKSAPKKFSVELAKVLLPYEFDMLVKPQRAKAAGAALRTDGATRAR